jgi:hypothetical protein
MNDQGIVSINVIISISYVNDNCRSVLADSPPVKLSYRITERRQNKSSAQNPCPPLLPVRSVSVDPGASWRDCDPSRSKVRMM